MSIRDEIKKAHQSPMLIKADAIMGQLNKGDVEGHEFHGNQYSPGGGGDGSDKGEKVGDKYELESGVNASWIHGSDGNVTGNGKIGHSGESLSYHTAEATIGGQKGYVVEQHDTKPDGTVQNNGRAHQLLYHDKESADKAADRDNRENRAAVNERKYGSTKDHISDKLKEQFPGEKVSVKLGDETITAKVGSDTYRMKIGSDDDKYVLRSKEGKTISVDFPG